MRDAVFAASLRYVGSGREGVAACGPLHHTRPTPRARSLSDGRANVDKEGIEPGTRKQPPRLNYREDTSRISNVREWVAIEDNDIGDPSRGQHAESVFQAGETRRANSGAPQRLTRREPRVFNQQPELLVQSESGIDQH